MTGISSNDRLIKVFYNADSLNDREARAYITSLKKQVQMVNLSKERMTERQWAGILEGLQLSPEAIIDKKHPALQNTGSGTDLSLSLEGWLGMLARFPQIVEGTIVVEGEQAHYFKTPKAIIAFVVGRPDSQNNSRN